MPLDQLPPFVLKDGETFAMLDRRGEISPVAHPDSGVFHRGMRHVSQLELLLWGHPPSVLSSTEREEMGLHVSHLSNDGFAAGSAPAGTVHLERSTVLTPTGLMQQLSFTSYAPSSLTIPLVLLVDADFLDIFEVRGLRREQRGTRVYSCTADSLEVVYRGLDAIDRSTALRVAAPVQDVSETELRLSLDLEPRCTRKLALVLDFHHHSEDSCSPQAAFDGALLASVERFRSNRLLTAAISTDNPAFNAWIARSTSDVHLLSTQLDHGLYPYAGVPWFSCPFGRDGLITARQMLLVEPRLARGVLGFLAEQQARHRDASSDAEPGKILHEARLGEMAVLGEVPFSRYYGSVDATPLFVMLAGDYLLRSDDRAFIDSLRPALDRALAWIRQAEAKSPDGFLRYLCAAQGGLRNQGWKDSDDAVHHADGRLAEGSIALCEVQAYAYGARRAMAAIEQRCGQQAQADRLLQEASDLRRRFHGAYWCESIGTYALALDGAGVPCKVRSSNAGHCLWTGIASQAAAASIARELLAPTSFNGWGVRTLDEREARFNPMSYHNGSVWPHDNAMIGLGLARYGHSAEVMRILTGLFETACAMPQYRLPELFCGFPRQEGEAPTHYPVACSPQAWASGSVFGLMEAITGMGLGRDSTTGRVQVLFRNPVLPKGLDLLEIAGLRLGEEEIDLQLHRSDHDTGVLVGRRTPGVDVMIWK
ncbi:glycogen debranching N-terminal domain-containing protein [Cyanobium sp. Morenito 9A2]|uniref:amylo-alpha-1,6-glucosidase n=1 Tax=Cyanobium sp. Morenito 9A2 TaxID=2823718 RepID=UPI0020CDC54B|nr:glycogen debranching N-terminal domain-containing protein [Cyanobium sp. Morenito 9A2]MCP9848625.1 amylo-alpha-1,6-glucosidase [Cyanobium sp. Morenito 9A2]